MSQASYKGRRLSLPRLANTYCAIQESAQYTFGDSQLLLIPNSTSMNELIRFEPIFQPSFFIDPSPLCTAMFQRYAQFRVRKVAVRLTESSVNPTNVGRSDVWVYWCPNHTTFDAAVAAGSSFSLVTDIAEASRFQHVAMAPGQTVNLEVIPQVIFQNAVVIGGVNIDQAGDGKMPWMDCTTANKNTTNLRMPIFYFRRPTAIGTNVPVHEPVFQVLMVAIFEFRNLEDDN